MKISPPASTLNNTMEKSPPDTAGAGGGTGTVTSITATAPIVVTPSPITNTGVISSTVFVGSGGSHAVGDVPDPGSTAGTGRFLREDATWAIPTATGGDLSALGLRKRWVMTQGYSGSSGDNLPTSVPWTTTAPSITSQNPDWTTDWLSINKSLVVSVAANPGQVAYRAPGMQVAMSAKTSSGFFFVCRVGWHTRSANTRCFFGMRTVSALFGNVDPSSTTNLVGFGADSADSQFTFMHNDSAGTATKDTINGGTGFPANTQQTDFFEFAVWVPAGSTAGYNWKARSIFTGTTASGLVTTDMPATDTALMPWCWWSNGTTTTAITTAMTIIYCESDY